MDLSAQYLGVMIVAPNMSRSVAQVETRLLEIRYIGATKERAPGEERSRLRLQRRRVGRTVP